MGSSAISLSRPPEWADRQTPSAADLPSHHLFAWPTGTECTMDSTELSSRGDTGPSSARVKRQRQSWSCTECTRRKLRCTKRIPCMACIERGIANQCQRRSDPTRKEMRRRLRSPDSVHPSTLQPLASTNRRSCSPELTPRPSAISNCAPSVVDSVSPDAAVMLEFLALNRRHVLQAAQIDRSQTAEPVSNAYELLFTVAQVQKLMSYHQECIAWTHNVVHMPTFIEQCEGRLSSGAMSIEAGWLSLYYAMLAVRIEESRIYSHRANLVNRPHSTTQIARNCKSMRFTLEVSNPDTFLRIYLTLYDIQTSWLWLVIRRA